MTFDRADRAKRVIFLRGAFFLAATGLLDRERMFSALEAGRGWQTGLCQRLSKKMSRIIDLFGSKQD